MKENEFQRKLIKDIKQLFPDCIILKNDPTYIQGIPDLIILYNTKWIALECKQNIESKHRPNQDYWIDKMKKMSSAYFIYPENKDEVLSEMKRYFLEENKDMLWNDHSREMPDGSHAFLSPSSHSWLNYDEDKLSKVYYNKVIKVARGTKLHELACKLIEMGVYLPDKQETLNMYVNDAIKYDMSPEVKLWYSKYCNGTADAMSVNIRDKILRIHDLKTGDSPVSFDQLKIYAALFFLEYKQLFLPGEMKTVLQIYKNNEILQMECDMDEIVRIMGIIMRFDRKLSEMEEIYKC